MEIVNVESQRFGERFEFNVALSGELAGRHVRALVHRPIGYHAAAPTLVVMHGVRRAADQYMSSWMELSERQGFLLVVPEFSVESWPKSRSYNLGNMRRRDGTLRPRAAWSFTVLEGLVELVLERMESATRTFSLYGHSAGAQFVHRYVLFAGSPRLSSAVAANAGWYTLPSRSENFPYGIGGMPHGWGRLGTALSTRLTVMVGDRDTDCSDPDLRQTPEAMAQGAHRLARARHFIDRAGAAARELGIESNWSLREVPGVAHNDRDLAAIAARILLEGDRHLEGRTAGHPVAAMAEA